MKNARGWILGSLGSIEGNIYGSARNEGERPNETGLFLLREKWNLNLEILSQLSLRVLIKVSSLQSERKMFHAYFLVDLFR